MFGLTSESNPEQGKEEPMFTTKLLIGLGLTLSLTTAAVYWYQKSKHKLPIGRSGRHVFISYRRKSSDKARLLKTELQRNGYETFMDLEGLKSGNFQEKLEEILRGTPVVILLLTPGCLTTHARWTTGDTDWVQREIQLALYWNKLIIPVMTQDFDIPSEFASVPEDDVGKIKELNIISCAFDQSDRIFHASVLGIIDGITGRHEVQTYKGDDKACWADAKALPMRKNSSLTTVPKDLNLPIPRQKTSGPTVLATETELEKIVKTHFKAAILVVGFGAKGGFADLKTLYAEVDNVVFLLDETFGKGNWLAMFGGDQLNKIKPDIAFVMEYLQTQHYVKICAIQANIVRDKWGGVDKHLDYVYYYPTHYNKEMNGKEIILWGGWDKSEGLRGASRTYFSDAMIDCSLLKGVVAIGGGLISRQEIRYSLHVGVPVAWIKIMPKFPESVWSGSEEKGSHWGPVSDFMEDCTEAGVLIKNGAWRFLDQDSGFNVLKASRGHTYIYHSAVLSRPISA
jgi:hypothetical protein